MVDRPAQTSPFGGQMGSGLLGCCIGAGDTDLLVAAGEPVLPLPDEAAFNALAAALRPFGMAAARVPHGAVAPYEESIGTEACETVLSLGAEHADAARLYAHLTGRRHATIERSDDISRFPDAAVLIGLWDQLRVRDFELIYDHCLGGSRLGLLLGLDRDRLLARLSISWAHASAAPDLLPLPSHAVLGAPVNVPAEAWFDACSYNETDAEMVAELLRGPTAALAFLGHSDGIDARLSNRAILCARAGAPVVALDRRPPNCDLTGYCHRRHLVRSDAIDTGELLSPRMIATRMLLMMSCYVARPSDCSVHPEYGLLVQLLENPRVGAVVAAWEVAFPTVGELIELAAPLLGSATVGDALAGFRASARGALRGCNRYLLFGDPRCRAGSPDASVSPKPRAVWAPAPAAIQPDVPARNTLTDWLSARLDRFARDSRPRSNGEPRLSAEMIASGRAALSRLHVEAKRTDCYRDLLRAILTFEGSGFVHWYEEASDIPEFVDRPTTCFGCGGAGRLSRLPSRFGTRWMACCARCDSFYADTPEGSDLIDGHFRLCGPSAIEHSLPPLPNGVIGLNLRSSLEIRSTWMIEEPLDLTDLPPGRSWLWLHALSDDGLYSYSRMIDNRPLREAVGHDPG